MNDFFKNRLKQCSIPTQDGLPISEFRKWKDELFIEFVKNNANILVIGEKYYDATIKLVRMKLIKNITQEMMWVSQSTLTDEFVANFDKETLALVQLFPETVEYRKRLAGSLVNRVLSYGGKIIIGCEDTAIMDKVFPYDIDTIEHNFEVWKV